MIGLGVRVRVRQKTEHKDRHFGQPLNVKSVRNRSGRWATHALARPGLTQRVVKTSNRTARVTTDDGLRTRASVSRRRPWSASTSTLTEDSSDGPVGGEDGDSSGRWFTSGTCDGERSRTARGRRSRRRARRRPPGRRRGRSALRRSCAGAPRLEGRVRVCGPSWRRRRRSGPPSKKTTRRTTTRWPSLP